jgi:hypothetical protein
MRFLVFQTIASGTTIKRNKKAPVTIVAGAFFMIKIED